MQEVCDVPFRVLVLGTPEQRVERTNLDTDSAVHAQRVVDIEAIEHAHATFPTAFAPRRTLLLVSLDVDAPVWALARAEHAHRAVLFFERNDPARPRGRILAFVRVL